MRGLINNAPYDYPINDNLLRSSISIGVICPETNKQQLVDFLNCLNYRHDVKYNLDFVIPYPGFYEAYKMRINLPNGNSDNWLSYNTLKLKDQYEASIELGNTISRKLDQINTSEIDVVIIYIPKEYEYLTEYNDGTRKFDLHDSIKAYSVQKGITTQFIKEKTIESDMLCQIMWALSLAIYVKSNKIPWIISGIQKETAFVGIGYSVEKRTDGNNIILGCSHIYSSEGHGLRYKLSKIDEVTFDSKSNPYLSENEAYKLGLNIKELFYKSFTDIPKRVVIHKRTPFKNSEIKGLVNSLSSLGIKDIDLLELTFDEELKCFELDKTANIADGFPIKRGMCFLLNVNTMYLFTHGFTTSIRNENFKYIQGGKTIPLPIKIIKHYGRGSVTQIASEILGLTKMNWNSFGLYSKLPCTIDSSNEIARIGRLLSKYENFIYDYRFFM